MDLLNVPCTENCFKWQRELSAWQAIPVVGPIIVSPIKAMASLVQIIVGFAASFFLAFAAFVCGSKTADKLFCDTCMFTVMGMLALGYSLLNIFTLGIAGCQIEQGRDARSRPF